MRSFLGVLAFTFMLAACGGGTSNTAPIVQWVLANCGVIVDGVGVAAVTASGQPLAGAATAVVGNAICTAWKTKGTVSALVGNAKPCPTVNGICVNGTVSDQSKLDSYKPK